MLVEYENIHPLLQQLLLFSVAVKLLIRQQKNVTQNVKNV